MLNDKVDRIFCINLDKRPDRWAEASSLFERFNVSVERVSGIEDEIPWNGLRMTVIGIFERAIKEGYETILIFEDDVDWSEDFYERFETCWESLPQRWDMFYFSAAHQHWPPVYNEHLFKLSWSTAAHAIVFKRSCFETVLSSLKRDKEAIDVIYSKLQPNLDAYCCIDPIAWQRRSFSDIEGEEKWYPYLKDVTFYERYLKGLVTIDDREIRPNRL
jgi:GR25 family glycosyltransferase involved in LPS biosynthesis